MALPASILETARGVVALAVSNPFLPERIEAEKALLGGDYRPLQPVWSARADVPEETPNVAEIRRRAEALAAEMRRRLAAAKAADAEAVELYEDVALYVLYERFRDEFRVRAARALTEDGAGDWRGLWREFAASASELLSPKGIALPRRYDAAHLFAFFLQIRRAFSHIFGCLVGGSLAIARLRAAVWQSIFTHDIRRYHRALWSRMGDLNTLVTGPSGTGKELVARAIGLSRYVPFDPKGAGFRGSFTGEFHAVNVSTLSPTLVESELFGHRKGAFTGALADRAGWFEVCGPYGAVLLDEIGELDPALQVKLLRVLEERTFVPLGDSRPRHFAGKAIAATNRDLAVEMREGRFREDLYYRLCADVVRTPSLAEQLAEAPEEIVHLVRFLAGRLLPDEGERDAFVEEAVAWIGENLGREYPWPGNVRELEQCVRNLLLRRSYRPAGAGAAAGEGAPGDALADAVRAGTLSADELLTRYTALVFEREGSYEGAARRLGLDRRTVKRRVLEARRRE